MATEAQKRAVAKRRLKLESLRFDFNVENPSDVDTLFKFKELSKNFKSKKEAFTFLVKDKYINMFIDKIV